MDVHEEQDAEYLWGDAAADAPGGKMKPRLIVKYDGFNEEMERELVALLERHGWQRWASGRNMLSGVRDIAFEREGDEHKRDSLDGV